MKNLFILLSGLLSFETFANPAGPAFTPLKDPTYPAIAIVGAGPSGLTAAHELSRMGYTNITIFEAGKKAGGKVFSVPFEGKVIEFGAIWSSLEYEVVRELAEETGVKLAPFEPEKEIITRDLGSLGFQDYLERRFFSGSYFPMQKVGTEYRALRKLVTANTGFILGDFSQAGSELYQSAEDYFALHELIALPKLLGIFLSASGYGYADEVPALYFMKGMDMLLEMAVRDFTSGMLGRLSFQAPPLYIAPEGFQQIWTQIAKKFDVRYNTPVRLITRTERKIQVTTGDVTREFDRLVFAANTQIAPQIIQDLTTEERSVLNRIETYPYVVTAFKAKGLAKNKAYFIEENIDSKRRGHVLGFGNRWSDDDLFVAYQFADPEQHLPELEKKLREDLLPLGASNLKVIHQEKWNFFPHFKTEALKDRAYEKINQMQGRGGLYFVGGLMGFETVEHSARQAKHLMRHVFR